MRAAVESAYDAKTPDVLILVAVGAPNSRRRFCPILSLRPAAIRQRLEIPAALSGMALADAA